jgi:hypothetical protein
VELFAAQDAIPHCVNSFELFGFDLLIDRYLELRDRRIERLVKV